MEKNNGTSNGPKAFGAVVALVAVVAGVYAMVEPMGQRIAGLQERLKETREDLKGLSATHLRTEENHATVHTDFAARMAAMGKMFVEVETQFRSLDRRVTSYEEWAVWWQRTVPALDASQDEKIKALERQAYDNK